VHIATFFTYVRPELVLRFAQLHGIPTHELASAYREINKPRAKPPNRVLGGGQPS
jgi:hypothetical protein